MKLGYDNLEDARAKLQSTYCLYDNKAILVKYVQQSNIFNTEEPPIFTVDAVSLGDNKIPLTFYLEDPKFNCSNFNIGYMNSKYGCSWFYRLPVKQYKQGLKHDQVQSRVGSQANYPPIDFKPSVGLANMLENKYPNIKDVMARLKKCDISCMAFHKNFALSYDDIHLDYIIEYKGHKVGFFQNLDQFNLLNSYKHIEHALQEAVA